MASEASPLLSPRVAASSRSHAFLNQLKCLVGIGSLTLPYVTARVGLALSLLGVCSLGYLSWEGIRLTIYCVAHVRSQREEAIKGPKVPYPASQQRPRWEHELWRDVSFASFGGKGWAVTLLALLLSQLGVATSYLDQIVAVLTAGARLPRSTSHLIVWAVLSVLCLMTSPGMRFVAYFSSLALLTYLYLFALLAYFGVSARTHRVEEPLVLFNCKPSESMPSYLQRASCPLP